LCVMTMGSSSTTKIDANGDVVRLGEEGAERPSLSTVLRSGNTIDVFGFNLEWRQLCIVLGILSFMIGLRGSK